MISPQESGAEFYGCPCYGCKLSVLLDEAYAKSTNYVRPGIAAALLIIEENREANCSR